MKPCDAPSPPGPPPLASEVSNHRYHAGCVHEVWWKTWAFSKDSLQPCGSGVVTLLFFQTARVDWLSSMRVSVGLDLVEGGGKESMWKEKRIL